MSNATKPSVVIAALSALVLAGCTREVTDTPGAAA